MFHFNSNTSVPIPSYFHFHSSTMEVELELKWATTLWDRATSDHACSISVSQVYVHTIMNRSENSKHAEDKKIYMLLVMSGFLSGS